MSNLIMPILEGIGNKALYMLGKLNAEAQEIALERLATCKACDNVLLGICAKDPKKSCYCAINLKPFSLNKDNKCPQEKWIR